MLKLFARRRPQPSATRTRPTSGGSTPGLLSGIQRCTEAGYLPGPSTYLVAALIRSRRR
jgi:hypothetical protein